MESERQKINNFLHRGFSAWRRAWWFWQLAYALWVGLLTALASRLLNLNLPISVTLGMLAGTAFLYWRYKFPPKCYPDYSTYLAAFHYRNPQLNWAAGLLNQINGNRSPVQQIQYSRLVQSFSEGKVYTPSTPHGWPLPVLLGLLFLIFIAGAWLVPAAVASSQNLIQDKGAIVLSMDSTQLLTNDKKTELAGIGQAKLLVSPPGYTRQAARYTQLSTGGIPEGSKLTWQVWPEGRVNAISLVTAGDTIPLNSTTKGRFTIQQIASKSGVYRLVAQNKDTATASDFYELKVIPDRPPQLSISQTEQYRANYTGNGFSFTAKAEDDWGLAQVWLELTISRGSGENVQFSTNKKWLKSNGKSLSERLKIDPREIGMKMGDELYYRLVAQDNREPRWQENSTSSYYYRWQDSTQVTMLGSGLALDVEPEYFRSQRQIIIDTEKLIADRPEISSEEFIERSESIGVDQKLLRLRYGKFLGEEFESSVGPSSAQVAQHEPDHEEEENHDHDHDHDHEEHDHGGHDHNHDHADHDHEPGGAGENLLEGYAHFHDTEEGATFYEESVKVRLKSALAFMWDSELQLRTHNPKAALPHQYNALKIIKEIQQQTRVYVERVGFEAPQIIEEKVRLSGERDDAGSVRFSNNYVAEDSLKYLKYSLAYLGQWYAPKPISPEVRAQLSGLSQFLAEKSSGGSGPGYVNLLNKLEALLKKPQVTELEAEIMYRQLLPLLPKPQASNLRLEPTPLFNLRSN